MYPIRTGTILAIAVAVALVGASPAAAKRPRCWRDCRALMRHSCSFDFGSLFDHRRGSACDRRIVRDCRRNGPAACEQATACDRACQPISAQCNTATIAAAAFVCDYPFLRCEEHGAGYCTEAPTKNGCNRVVAEDHRRDATVVVTFGTNRLEFPACVLVSPGTTIRFEGVRPSDPPFGGEAPTVDPTSPFNGPYTLTGSARGFVLTTPGIFPYFHDESDGVYGPARVLTWGAVIVDDPE